MASHFAQVSIIEAAVPANTKKSDESKVGLSVFSGRQKIIFFLNLQQNHKNTL